MLSPSGDYTFGNGQLNFYQDSPQAVGQLVQTRILLWLGEWFLDINEGTPFMQGILGKKSLDVANATIKSRILGTQGVTGITNITSSVNPSTRVFTFSADIDTIYGPTTVTTQNQLNY